MPRVSWTASLLRGGHRNATAPGVSASSSPPSPNQLPGDAESPAVTRLFWVALPDDSPVSAEPRRRREMIR